MQSQVAELAAGSDSKLDHWQTLDPVTDEKEWLELGLELGQGVAAEAHKRSTDSVFSRFAMSVFSAITKLSGIGKKAIGEPADDSLQRPWMTKWPKLSGRPFHPVNALENADLVKANWKVICEELEALNSSEDSGFEKAIYDGFGGKPWKTSYFYLFGQRNNKLHELCPRTSELLDRLPDNHMHTCFSRIEGGATLPPHVGASNAWLIAHLGLINCEDTYIFSGDQKKKFEEGEWLILDDSFVHGVTNYGTKPRYTLMVTFYHPELNKAEKTVLKTIIKTIALLTAPLFKDGKSSMNTYE